MSLVGWRLPPAACTHFPAVIWPAAFRAAVFLSAHRAERGRSCPRSRGIPRGYRHSRAAPRRGSRFRAPARRRHRRRCPRPAAAAGRRRRMVGVAQRRRARRGIQLDGHVTAWRSRAPSARARPSIWALKISCALYQRADQPVISSKAQVRRRARFPTPGLKLSAASEKKARPFSQHAVADTGEAGDPRCSSFSSKIFRADEDLELVGDICWSCVMLAAPICARISRRWRLGSAARAEDPGHGWFHSISGADILHAQI